MNMHHINGQALALSFKEILGLPVYGRNPDTGRVKKTTLKNMNPIFLNSFVITNSTNSQVQYDYLLNSPSLGAVNLSTIVALPATPEQIIAKIRSDVVAAVLSNWSTTVTPTDVYMDMPGLGVSSKAFSNPSLAINTSRQPSTTRDVMVNASVDITTTLSLSGGTAGKVELKYADDSGFTTNVKTTQSFTNSNTGTLTLGLNTSQIGTAAVSGIIPAGKYYRLVTTNVTGTPTYGTPAIQEVLL